MSKTQPHITGTNTNDLGHKYDQPYGVVDNTSSNVKQQRLYISNRQRKQTNNVLSRKGGSRKGRKRPTQRSRNISMHTGSISELSPINNCPIQVRAMRYMGTITTTTDFRVADMTTILLAVTSGSTSAIKIIEAFKLKSVAITCLPSSDTNSGTFAFTWVGEREPHTTQTMFYSQGQPSKWTFYPPEFSFASFWITQDTSETTSSLFLLDPDNSVVKIVLDLNFEYVLCDGASSTITLSAAATFTGIAARVMPGAATDELVPVGIVSVTS